MASKTKVRLGWHFLPASRQLEYSDGRLVKVGEALRMRGTGQPACCVTGMHASEEVRQAANFQRGPVLCRVQVWGDIDEDSDKFCGRYRRVIWMHEVKGADMAAIAREIGHGTDLGISSDGNVVSYLFSLRNTNGFEKSVKAWARRNGWSDKAEPVTISLVRPALTEKDLLMSLSPRVIRTKKEILAGLAQCFDLNVLDDEGSYEDAFDELVDSSDRIVVIDDIDGRGTVGFIARPTRR